MSLQVYSILAILWLSVEARAAVDFSRQVHPILTARCMSCHGANNPQGGLNLTTRAGVLRTVTPGDSKGSVLLQRINGDKPPRMPMGGDPLAADEIALIAAWIDEGAKGGDDRNTVPSWTAPLLPRRPTPPTAVGNPIDAFLGTASAPVVSDALFARRAYLDLWGLLPTPEQLREFERRPDRAKLVDRLLADKDHYAQHWISFWNDLLRNDDGVMHKALRDNVPYDRFVATLLNPVKKKDPEGFILGVTWRGEVPASERPPLQAAQNSAQTFLGINLKCNSCHDSFISNWKLKDAYGLASFFSPDPLELVRCDAKTGEMSKPKFLFPELGEVRSLAADGSLRERRGEAARLFTARENGRLTRTIVNRYWKQLMGRGIVEPVDDMAAQPWNADLLDWLAATFAQDQRYDTKRLLRQILTSRAYQMTSAASNPLIGQPFPGPLKRRLSAEQFADAIAAITGDWRYKPMISAKPTRYVREWELKSTALTRALGRPVRDQVVTERLTQPTTLQAIELVNGQYLANWLHEAAERLVTMPPPPPENLFDSGVIRRNSAKVDLKLKGVTKLHFLVENHDSYDPTRVVPMWKDAVFVNGGERVKLSELISQDPEELTLPARFTVDLRGKKFKRFQATVQVTKASTASDVGPAIRFFLFDRDPDPRQLVRVDAKSAPVPAPTDRFTPDTLLSRLYLHAFQREPVPAEQAVAREILGATLSVDAVEDLLWMIFESPEFQYIQ
jgi:hypothetical protein